MTGFLKAIAIMAMIGGSAFPISAAAADNATLKQLFEADQADRTKPPADIAKMGERDRERQRIALEHLQRGAVLTAKDHFHAALIFQHSDNVEDNALAFSLATIAARMDPNDAGARWLAAAAWDRVMVRRNKPQWYGTQFVRDKQTGKWVAHPVDEKAVTEEERIRHVGRPLSKMGEVLDRMNREG